MKIFVRAVLSLIVIILIAAVVFAAAAVNMNKAPEGMPDESIFRVNKGENATSIGNRLEEEGLITNSRFFIAYVRLKNTGGLMKSGLYRIPGGLNCLGIHDVLLKGSEELFRVAVPPGLTAREIAVILEAEGITDARDFTTVVEELNAEGFLYPDTYNFPKDYPAEKVAGYMIDTFHEVMDDVYPEYGDYDEEQMLEKVTMASIIEREYRVEDEAPLIASVFYNRIEQNMYLGSCATVVYVITEELEKEHPEKLLYRDLKIDSDYNTYINKGLPPGPICNPGRAALDAAFNPYDTDYLYFLLEDPAKGTHFFSKTLAEHNKSYELYIKGK